MNSPAIFRSCVVALALCVGAAMYSCGSSSAVRSGGSGVVTYNIELKQVGPDIVDPCNPAERVRSIQTARKPELIPAGELSEPKYRVYAVPCAPNDAPVVYDIPESKVLRITATSDPLQPAKGVDSMLPPQGCCRDRVGWWIFDKLELRLALHYRGSSDSIFYASATGGTMYRSSTFGIDRGGSSLFAGFEIVGLWNAGWLDRSHRLQLGAMVGAWPVDGSLFIPLTFHPRYTFAQHPVQFSSDCDSWYLFGDIGVPVDFNTGAPLVSSMLVRQRYVIGVGVGYDWAWGCVRDFSIDAGYRRTNLPLPEIECCPQVTGAERYPFRASDALFLRFGITF